MPPVGQFPQEKCSWFKADRAVWFVTSDDGATADLRSHGVSGLVQWGAVKGNIWPQLARTVYSGSRYWSRPFDTLDRRRASSTGAAA